MSASMLIKPSSGDPLVFDTIAERAGIAATYAAAAADFATIGDRRGAAYSLRQAAIAISSAADAAAALRPVDGGAR